MKRPGSENIEVCFPWPELSEKSDKKKKFAFLKQKEDILPKLSKKSNFFFFATSQPNKCLEKHLLLFFVDVNHSPNIETNLQNIASAGIFAYIRPWVSSQLVQ